YDTIYEVEGICFVVEKSHEIYLYGMEIDWQGGLNSRGFTFNNPNASKTWGVGRRLLCRTGILHSYKISLNAGYANKKASEWRP
ncbi:MAG TPA: hypothetical protein VNS32_13475, partial [Flavisolibacter sp.]|nr:hypothetical protein [Flavisolibacter sp.]